jgi:hypothetical protein
MRIEQEGKSWVAKKNYLSQGPRNRPGGDVTGISLLGVERGNDCRSPADRDKVQPSKVGFAA